MLLRRCCLLHVTLLYAWPARIRRRKAASGVFSLHTTPVKSDYTSTFREIAKVACSNGKLSVSHISILLAIQMEPSHSALVFGFSSRASLPISHISLLFFLVSELGIRMPK